jgi:hypothetical protein
MSNAGSFAPAVIRGRLVRRRKTKLVDTAGRVERFQKKYAKKNEKASA